MFGLTLNSSILRDLKIPSKSKAVKLPTPTADVFADVTTGKSHIHSFKTQKHTSHVDRDRQF